VPYIFPKRRLKGSDILDPNDLNQDFTPVQELLSGKLDAKNFIANDLKTGVTAKAGAYYNTHYASVDVPVFLGTSRETTTMNFVRSDGTTIRPIPPGSSYPSIDDIFVIPNTQAWVPILDNSGAALKLSVTTDQANLWITGFAQYVWNGFFEPKGEAEQSESGGVWLSQGDFKKEPTQFLDSDGNQRAPYAYPIREADAEYEAANPDQGGYHHISRGEKAANVQFAIRIDGRIIEESITGKQGTYDREPKGMRAGDSKNRLGGQRGYKKKVTYSDSLPRPGQRVPDERAVGLGPEVLPVRLGCVVPVAPGSHTIEIIARRLRPLKDRQLKVGDYVGVFSRNLFAMELHSYAARATDRVSPPTIPNFESETGITSARMATNTTQKLESRLNDIRVADVQRNSLPNTHLPSKVKFVGRQVITPNVMTTADGVALSAGVSRARWPGWGTFKNNVLSGLAGGWDSAAAAEEFGWHMLADSGAGSATQLLISDSSLTTTADEVMMVMADVNLRRITPLPSNFISLLDDEERDNWRDYISFYQPHKYLDLYAAFSLGYSSDGGTTWNIVDAQRPAWINRYNWVGRDKNYRSIDGVFRFDSDSPTTRWQYTEAVETHIDGRGPYTGDEFQHTNIPLFWVVDSATTINRLAVFVTSAMPSWWMVNDAFSSGVKRRWRMPTRDIMRGLEVRWGNCSLSAIKVEK
jgi:hypothetical protein